MSTTEVIATEKKLPTGHTGFHPSSTSFQWDPSTKQPSIDDSDFRLLLRKPPKRSLAKVPSAGACQHPTWFLHCLPLKSRIWFWLATEAANQHWTFDFAR
jgi:hypothetical protein